MNSLIGRVPQGLRFCVDRTQFGLAKWFAAVFLAWCVPGFATTYPAVNSTNFPSGIYTEGYPSIYGEPLPYRYFLPMGYNPADEATKYPLVIFLHGDGQKGTDNYHQLDSNANGAMIFISSASPNNQANYPCIWVAPQFHNDRLPTQLEGLIVSLLNQFKIDPDRIYITGLSGGAGLVWNTLASYPNRFAAAQASCGWGTGQEAKHKHVPMWAFVCMDDGPAVLPAGTEDAVKRLRSAGGDPVYSRYLTGGHSGGWIFAYSANTPLVPWIMAQRRGQSTSNLSSICKVSTTTPSSNSAFVSNSTPIAFSGTCGDSSAGVTSVVWQNLSTSGSGTVAGTMSWTAAAVPVQSGNNLIRFLATGASYGSVGNGNTTFSQTLSVYYSPVADTVAPVVTITSPTTVSTYGTPSSLISLAGTASDNLGVVKVTWSNDRGGMGTATGTTSWSVTDIDLKPGVNVLTVTAYDASGNSVADVLTVTCGIANQPPVVNAGNDLRVILPKTAALVGSVSDDGVAPSKTPTVQWSKVSGPGDVAFGNPAAVSTTATFSNEGTYVLRLTGNDGELTASDDITVKVFSTGTYVLQFDFGGSTTTSGNWNNVTDPATGVKISNAIDMEGTGKGIKLNITTAFGGINTAGSTSANGAYPVTAMQDSFYVQNSAAAGLNLEGLDPAYKYTLSFFASRNGDGTSTNRVTSYIVGTGTVTLNATDNVLDIAEIPDVSPSSGGVISIRIINSISSGYGYLGVMEVAARPPSPLEVWRTAQFSSDASNPNIGGDIADPDRDGVANSIEYALGGDPKSSSLSILPRIGINGNRARISFARIARNDVTYVAEASDDLVVWTPIATLFANASSWKGAAGVTESGTGSTRDVIVEDVVFSGTAAKRFMRLSVISP